MEHMAEEYSYRLSCNQDIINHKQTNNSNISNTIFSNIQRYSHEEYQYLHLIENILQNGFWEQGRNGKTKSIFGHSMRFSLQNSTIPILTTKKTAWKTCLKELLWFIRGETDNTILKSQGVHIWDANGTREFLDSRELYGYQEDELGPIYGYQWRNFGKSFLCKKDEEFVNHNFEFDLNKTGTDQLHPLKRSSRRLIMTAWNPYQLNQMALPPCHILCQFNVHDGNKLSCSMYQRSVDTMLGQPFNIASYSFLTHLLAKHCGLEAYEFIYFMGNCHIYEEHIEGANLQINRDPYEFPTISIKQMRDNINDYNVEDFELHNYKHHEQIKMKMVA